MKKLVLPAIIIAATGGYFYYTNLDSTKSTPAMAEQVIVDEVEAAVAEADAGDSVGEMMASAEEDVFADVPEAMENALGETAESIAGVADESAEVISETVSEVVSETVSEVAEAAEAMDEVDHGEE